MASISPSPVHATTTTTTASIPTTMTTAHSTTGSTPTSTTFEFPPTYSFPPFFTLQPNSTTRLAQLHKWSSLIQSWCRHHRIWKLSVIDAVETPLFHNTTLRKRISLGDARIILDWMSKSEEEGGGGRRAEWVDGTGTSSGGLGSNGFGGTHQYSSKSDKTMAWIWWRTPEEWAGVVADWVESTGQKNMVLTVYELVEGEGTKSQEFHGMDTEVMLKSLNVLVKRGKAQIFGSEGQEGVKFF